MAEVIEVIVESVTEALMGCDDFSDVASSAVLTTGEFEFTVTIEVDG